MGEEIAAAILESNNVSITPFIKFYKNNPREI
jgi:hypothetical protein